MFSPGIYTLVADFHARKKFCNSSRDYHDSKVYQLTKTADISNNRKAILNCRELILYGVSMKKFSFLTVAAITAIISVFAGIHMLKGGETENTDNSKLSTQPSVAAYSRPEFYRGIYLTNPSGKHIEKLQSLVSRAKKANINVFVIDVQPAPQSRCSIPKANIDFLIKNGIHPVARVVCFDDGLKVYPIPESVLLNRINIAKSACDAGFKEIQFDYIRFNDYGTLARVPLQKRYEFIEGFLSRAKSELKPYNVRIAADVFGRIPLNSGDGIGQRMEGLDKVIDVICPMAYPSHYTWSKKMMSDPYYTVFLTSSRAKERVKQAEIVSYIQAFKIRVDRSGLSYDDYVLQQIKAVHDSKIKGYILWNAAQEYSVPFKVAEDFYNNKSNSQTRTTSQKKQTVL
jgi:hypothetical protein